MHYVLKYIYYTSVFIFKKVMIFRFLNLFVITEQFFEGIQVELEVFYFVDSCSMLSEEQKEEGKQSFLQFLRTKGLCKDGGIMACTIDGVTVECGPTNLDLDGDPNRHRRSSDSQMDELKFVFNIKMEGMSSKDYNCSGKCDNLADISTTDCQSQCRTNYMEESKQVLQQTTQKMKTIFGEQLEGSERDENVTDTPTNAEVTQDVQGTLHIDGMILVPKKVKVKEMEMKCGFGMGRTDGGCGECVIIRG